MEKKNVTINANEIQRVMREYFENLYLENLEEMDKCLDEFALPKLNQEDINNINITVTSNEIEAVIVSQQRKAQDPMDSPLNSMRSLKKK
jgi:hypothetical protein